MPFAGSWKPKVKRGLKKWARSRIAKRMKVPPAVRVHTFTRIASSNQNASNALPILVTTDSFTGRPKFNNTVNSGENLALQFRLDQVDLYLNGSLSSSFSLPNYTDFVNLFDEYCIKKVEISVLPSYASASPSAAVQSWIPWIIHAADYDDVNSTGSTSLMQYTGAKFTQLLGSMGVPNAPVLRTLYPRPKVEVLTATAGNGIAHIKGPVWIASSNSNTPHLGFKMCLDDSNAGGGLGVTICGLNIICKYTIQCRDVV